MAKKIPESKEDAATRRQRELAALTSGVAAFSLMGETPRPAAPAPESVEAPVPVEPTTTSPLPVAAQPAGAKPAEKKEKAAAAPVPNKVPTPAVAPVERVGERPAGNRAVVAPTTPSSAEQDSEDDEEEENPIVVEPHPEPKTQVETSELDLAQLFVPSSEKKGTTLRITADHQQFFTNLGFLLGNGASAPDIVHNILTRFRADHEAQIQKAMRKQMRQLLSPKK
ncbi:hypothetical protein [Hymenobacter negativus]|uniref:DUF3408 domain-containing protein n=1 Tax=Hymenobacter negativus TaxID=2795026 RepID=A0ABS3QLT0_9BACT|nr:hypothetical protein [Hymenobacter negativus]MBO2012229.1 hypothetical protein [Hymenobacter negativus]